MHITGYRAEQPFDSKVYVKKAHLQLCTRRPPADPHPHTLEVEIELL